MVGHDPQSSKTQKRQAVIQLGQVGFYPFNSVGLTALFHQQADCLLGFQDDAQATQLRQKQEFSVSNQTLSIHGKVFAGFSDSFYRGKLPEIIIITNTLLETPQFIDDYLDYIEKLLSLGFLTPTQLSDRALLDEFLPQMIIGTAGMVFDLLQQKLALGLDALGIKGTLTQSRFLQRFSRAVVQPLSPQTLGLMAELTLLSSPISIEIAGMPHHTMQNVSPMLDAHHIPLSTNPNGAIGIQEIELRMLYCYLIARIFPILKPKLSLKQTDIAHGMEALAQHFEILPGLVTLLPDDTDSSDWTQMPLSQWDVLFLQPLARLAAGSQISEAIHPIQQVIEALKTHLEKSKP